MSTEPEPTEEELRIWIAERCGWTVEEMDYPQYVSAAGQIGPPAIKRHFKFYRWTPPPGSKLARIHNNGMDGWSVSVESAAWHLPDYARDLNAMHEAENAGIYADGEIDSDLVSDYLAELVIQAAAGKMSSATALQRARAFYLATKNG